MIRLIAVGNVGRDANVNDVNGRKVINFTVAHTEKYKDNAGVQHDKTTWMECAYWTDKTNVAQYIKKGTLVCIQGQPESRAYQTAQGECRSSLAVRIEKIDLLGSPKGSSDSSGNSSNTGSSDIYNRGNTNTTDIVEPVDDLPF